MRIIGFVLAASLVTIYGAAQAAPRLTGEAKLAKMIGERVAEKPVNCISQRDIRSSTIIRGVGVVYEGRSGTLFVNRPRSGAAFLDEDDILFTDTHSDQLCSIDTVKLIDRGSHMSSGFIALEKFVPYRRLRNSVRR